MMCATLFDVCGYLKSRSLGHALPLNILFKFALRHKHLACNLKVGINTL